jgi:hypothetical protein
MDASAIPISQATVETSGFLTRRHRIRIAGQTVGELTIGWGSSAAYTNACGGRAVMARPSLVQPEYRMWQEGQERAAAHWRVFERLFEVQLAGQTFLLRPAGLPAFGVWELVDPAGALLLTVRRSGWRQSQIDVRAPLDGDLLPFAYYLVLMRRRAERRV